LILFLVSSCNHKKEDSNVLDVKAKQQASLIRDYHSIDSLYKIGISDTATLLVFMQEAVDFANAYPEDKSAPEILIRASNIAMRLAQEDIHQVQRAEYAKQAIDMLDQFLKVYPEHEQAKYCYWWKGIIYHEILKMYPSAENEYREFLHKFPNDSLVSTVRFSLENIGKTAPEIMAEIEQNNP